MVKGEVCKTSIQRFESARRLHQTPEQRKIFRPKALRLLGPRAAIFDLVLATSADTSFTSGRETQTLDGRGGLAAWRAMPEVGWRGTEDWALEE